MAKRVEPTRGETITPRSVSARRRPRRRGREAGGDRAGPAGRVAGGEQARAALGQPVGELTGELAVVPGDLGQGQAGDVADSAASAIAAAYGMVEYSIRRAVAARGSHRASRDQGCSVLRQPTSGGRNSLSRVGLR